MWLETGKETVDHVEVFFICMIVMKMFLVKVGGGVLVEIQVNFFNEF